MNILQITPTFIPSKFGGVKTISYLVSHSLVNRGHSVTVYTTDAEIGNDRLKIDSRHIKIENIEIRYFRNLNNIMAYRFRVFLPFGFFSAIKKELSKYDIIHIHDFRSYLSIVTCYYAKRNKIPYIIQAHGSLPRYLGKTRFKQIFDILWGYSILHNATKVIALTTYESQQYIKMGVSEEKIEIIPNGIDYSEFLTTVENGAFRKKYRIDITQRIVLFIGRINKIKGIDLLIESFFEVYKDFPNCILIIVGPDDGFLSILKDQIYKLKIQNNIIFTGPLYGIEKYEVYHDADVFVLPSIYDAFPNTVLEAWVCRTPVIVTKGCLISNIVKNAGYVVDANAEELSLAILNIFRSSREQIRTITDAGYHLIETELNLNNCINKLENLYRETICR